MGGIQYLSGYVLHKLINVAKKIKVPAERESDLKILQNGIGTDETQNFIHAINRCGLKSIKKNGCKCSS